MMSVENHLFNRLFRLTSKKAPTHHITVHWGPLGSFHEVPVVHKKVLMSSRRDVVIQPKVSIQDISEKKHSEYIHIRSLNLV